MSLGGTVRGTVRRDGALVVPAAAGTMALGYAVGEQPLLGFGLGGLTVLSLLPWAALYLVFVATAMLQSHFLPLGLGGVAVGSITLRPEEAIIVPLAFRAFLMSAPGTAPRWGLPDFLLISWALLNPVSSLLKAPNFGRSIQPAGLLVLGILAYLTVFRSVARPARIRFAARWFIGLALFNSAYGFAATMAHYLAGTSFGVSTRSQYGAGTYGFMFEHDIFASTCAATAVILYVLWREESTLFSRRTYVLGFWVSLISMFAGLARGAWVAFFVAMVAVVVVSRRNRPPARLERVALTAFTLAAAAVLVVLLLGRVQTDTTYISKDVTKSGGGTGSVLSGIYSKLNELTNISTGTGAARLSEARSALDDLAGSPVIGLGTLTYDQRHPLKDSTNYIGNLWIRTLYDTGIVGFLLLALGIGVNVWPGKSLLRPRGEYATLARALTFGWYVLVVAYAATDDTLFMWPWIFLGLVRGARYVAERQHRHERHLAAVTPGIEADGGAVAGNGRGTGLVPLRPPSPGPFLGPTAG